MSPQSKEEYFEVLFKRYKAATRREKTKIIDECCTVCGYHRKHAIRRLRGHKRFIRPKKRGNYSASKANLANSKFTLFQTTQGDFAFVVV